MPFDSTLTLLRDAARGVVRHPGPSWLAVLALSLGIGATTAMFSVVDAVLFRSLPAERPEELVRVLATDEARSDFWSQSYPVYADYRDQSDAFASLAAYSEHSAAHLSAPGRTPERVTASLATGDFFELLGLRPQHGRLLRADDDRPEAAPVVVLADRCFRRRFSGDPGVVGSSVRINGHSVTVVGVAPRGFTGLSLESLPELYVPMAHHALVEPENAAERPLSTRRFVWLDIVGRLRPGVDVAGAQASLDLVARRRAARQPAGERDPLAQVVPAGQLVGGSEALTTRRVYWLLLAVAATVLLVACADAAGLLLARGESRRRELAIRIAVGASRGRIARQLLAESLLLAGAAAGLGMLVAAWGTEALVAAVPPEVALPLDAATPVLDARVLGVAALAAIVSGLVAGLAPALRGSRVAVDESLRDEAGATVSGRRVSLRHALVVAEVALCSALLVGAGLLVRSLLKLNALPSGFEPRGLVLASFDVARQGYSEARGKAVQGELLRALRSTAGVQGASLVRSAPVQAAGMRVTFEPEGHRAADGQTPHADFNVASPGHFAALGVAVLRGRDFSERDVAQAPPVVIVSRSLAERHWPGQDPIGKRIADLGPSSAPAEVVGVVADFKLRDLTEAPRPVIYAPLAQWHLPRLTLVVRSGLETQAALATLRAAVARVDPELPLFQVRTLADQIQASLARQRLLALLFAGFGAIALLLAWAGLYGLVSFVTALRTREIGVRVALGARASDVERLVLGQSLALCGLGLALGLLASLGVSRALAGFLYGVAPIDALTLATVGVVLLAAGSLAGHLPARRALRLDPSAALRHQ